MITIYDIQYIPTSEKREKRAQHISALSVYVSHKSPPPPKKWSVKDK